MADSIVARLEPRLREMAARLAEVDRRISDPAIARDVAALSPLLKERADLAKRLAPYDDWRKTRAALAATEAAASAETDPAMAELYRTELSDLAARLESGEQEVLAYFLAAEEDGDRNGILEIRAGTGGDEAGMWAADLFRMYLRYADKRGWKAELMSENTTDLGGFKEVVVHLVGDGVFERLKYESGGHRVQRIPTTEQQGRIHTSSATVAVLPEATEVEVELKEGDLRVDTYRASGAGGQHVNKTS